MHAFQPEPEEKFKPVHLVLDSQEEVDKVFALFNHSGLAESLGMFQWYSTLAPYGSRISASRYHSIIQGLFK